MEDGLEASLVNIDEAGLEACLGALGVLKDYTREALEAARNAPREERVKACASWYVGRLYRDSAHKNSLDGTTVQHIRELAKSGLRGPGPDDEASANDHAETSLWSVGFDLRELCGQDEALRVLGLYTPLLALTSHLDQPLRLELLRHACLHQGKLARVMCAAAGDGAPDADASQPAASTAVGAAVPTAAGSRLAYAQLPPPPPAGNGAAAASAASPSSELRVARTTPAAAALPAAPTTPAPWTRWALRPRRAPPARTTPAASRPTSSPHKATAQPITKRAADTQNPMPRAVSSSQRKRQKKGRLAKPILERLTSRRCYLLKAAWAREEADADRFFESGIAMLESGGSRRRLEVAGELWKANAYVVKG
jgi:hypothetical protein